MLSFDLHSGSSAVDLAGDLAQLHVQCLAGWPYFAIGPAENHERGFRSLLSVAGDSALVVIAKDGDKIVGATAGTRMMPDGAMFEPFMKANRIKVKRTYWISQMTILPEYRGSGASNTLSYMREDFARGSGLYDRIAFSAIVRPSSDPRRPVVYRMHDGMWNKRGYFHERRADVTLRYVDAGDKPGEPSEKTFQLWIKDLK